MALGPTHKACRQIGKKVPTIHSFFSKFTEKSYNKIAEKYMALPDELQKKTIRQALYIFLISFALMLILLFFR